MRRVVVLIAWLVVMAGVVGSAVASGASQFPASAYPPPIKARSRGALAACPNPSGLQRFDTKTTKLAVRIATSPDGTSLAVDLRNSDRAWWPEVRQAWRSGNPPDGWDNSVVYRSHRGPNIAYAVVVRFSCGSSLVAKSLAVYVGPRQGDGCSACVASVFFVDRRGRALIYWRN